VNKTEFSFKLAGIGPQRFGFDPLRIPLGFCNSFDPYEQLKYMKEHTGTHRAADYA
jgi:hypothetical protein